MRFVTKFGWIFVGVLALATRAALLPLIPIPEPVIYDEFSYLLGADTFAAGRITNPPPAIPAAFASPYILVKPTYNSKYPPAPALAMAIGQKLFGHPWFGVWLSAGAMCAAICWALEAWVTPGWALLGGILTLPLGVFSYWMDSYWGGALAAAAGALVLGAYGRIARRNQLHWSWLLGLGLAILANSRMFEGAIFGGVICAALLRKPAALARIAIVLALCAAAMGFYNAQVTGNPLRLPYIEYERQYASAPFFNFLPQSDPHFFANPVLNDLHQNWDLRAWQAARSPAILLKRPAEWWRTGTTLFGGQLLLLLSLAALPLLLRKKELRVSLVAIALCLAASYTEISYFDHYAAPIAAAVFLILIYALQQLRALNRWAGHVVLAVAFLLLCRAHIPALLHPQPFEATHPNNARKSRLEAQLISHPGRHLVIVRYTGTQSPHEEWVYNRADLPAAQVLWAHDLGDLENRRVIAAYPNRTLWLFEPDRDRELLIPLPSPDRAQ